MRDMDGAGREAHMNPMLIDTHCHLDFPDFAPERDAIVSRAREAGVGRMITISTHVDRFPTYAGIAEAYDNVFCTVGTHPHHAHDTPEASAAELVALAQHPKCVGIGEAGLDYHYDRAPRDVAQRVFRTHIQAARESGLPLVIHTRDADADTGAILEDEMGKGAFKALLHCFTASRELAERALEPEVSATYENAASKPGAPAEPAETCHDRVRGQRRCRRGGSRYDATASQDHWEFGGAALRHRVPGK